jgi:hypothetical protein
MDPSSWATLDRLPKIRPNQVGLDAVLVASVEPSSGSRWWTGGWLVVFTNPNGGISTTHWLVDESLSQAKIRVHEFGSMMRG